MTKVTQTLDFVDSPVASVPLYIDTQQQDFTYNTDVHGTYFYDAGANDWPQTIYDLGVSLPYAPAIVVSPTEGMAPIVVSPVALMTFTLSSKRPYYTAGSLLDYYAGKLSWGTPSGIVDPVTSQAVPVSKIIYCAATGDNSIFGKGIFVALTSAGIYGSADDTGATFSQITSCPVTPIDIAYSNGILLVVTATAAWFTGDGVNWTQLNNPVPPPYDILHTL